MVFLVIAMLPLISSVASANNCTAIYNYGDSEHRADIVIVGHGWPENGLNDFSNESKLIADYLLTYPPYSNYSGMINIWYVNQSADLGCTWPDLTCNPELTVALASQCPPDKIYVLMNDTGIGGRGGPSMSVGTIAPDLKGEIFVHELGGHCFGELMDEYVYSSSGGHYYNSGANCASPEDANWVNDTISCTKWGAVPGTGCYPGCSYSSFYRPSYTSIMNDGVSEYFNGPSQNQIEKMIVGFSDLTSDYSPKTDVFLELGKNQTFSITKVNESDSILIKWYVNGSEKTENENQTSFTFASADYGDYTVKAEAEFLKINESYSWNVTINSEPNITAYSPSEANPNVDENSTLEFSVTAEDADNDSLSYSWRLDGIEKAATQNWAYNPGFFDSGSHNATVLISDSKETVNHYWNVTVNNVNRAPVLNAIPEKTATANKTLKFNITASDPDSDSLNYYSNMTGMTINKINNNTAEASWTPDESYIGENYVEFKVSDGVLNSSQTAKITVNQNSAPNITAYSPSEANPNVDENSTLEFSVTAEDADNDSLSYSWRLDGEEKSTSQNWAYNPGFDDSGSHNVTVIVSDGQLTDYQYWNVSVSNVNRAPALYAIPEKSVNKNNELKFNISASDADGDTIAYSANSTLNVVKISNNIAEVSWTPNTGGIYYFSLIASDGNLSDTKTVKITVNNVNRAPVLSSIADITAYEGNTITISPSATDEDEDTITYSYSGWMTANSKQTGYSDAGSHIVNVTASDGSLSDSKLVNVNILNSYELRMAISDKITKARLTGTVTIGTGKQTTSASTATFDFIHAGEHSIRYSASGYKDNSYTVNFDNGLANCAQGSDCTLSSTSCKWNSQYSDFTCTLSNQFIFVFNPSQNAIKRIDYLVK